MPTTGNDFSWEVFPSGKVTAVRSFSPVVVALLFTNASGKSDREGQDYLL